MKTLHSARLTVAFVAGLLAVSTSASPILKVYLQAGQSNADGRAPTNGLSGALLLPQPDVLYYYYVSGATPNGDGTLGTLTTLRPGGSKGVGVRGPAFGPELTMGRALADYFGQTNQVSTNTAQVAILKYARGGTSLFTDWKAGGSGTTNGDGGDYIIFQKVVAAGLARLATNDPGATIELCGLVWVQGETDIDLASGQTGSTPNPLTVSSYRTNLLNLICDVRLTFGAFLPYGTNLPFILSCISTNQTAFSYPTNPAFPYYLSLRNQQLAVPNSSGQVFVINTDATQFSVGTIGMETSVANGRQHYDNAGQQNLGRAFAQTIITNLPRPTLGSPRKTASGWSIGCYGDSCVGYFLERAPAPIGPWLSLTNAILGSAHHFDFSDASPLPGQAFYRVRYQ